MPERDFVEAIAQLLQMGGNGAMIVFAWAIWRIERRLFAVEKVLELKPKAGGC